MFFISPLALLDCPHLLLAFKVSTLELHFKSPQLYSSQHQRCSPQLSKLKQQATPSFKLLELFSLMPLPSSQTKHHLILFCSFIFLLRYKRPIQLTNFHPIAKALLKSVSLCFRQPPKYFGFLTFHFGGIQIISELFSQSCSLLFAISKPPFRSYLKVLNSHCCYRLSKTMLFKIFQIVMLSISLDSP